MAAISDGLTHVLPIIDRVKKERKKLPILY